MRARAAGIGRMVTISTRVKRNAELLAISERFPDVFCSIGTHPHHAHEELHIDSAALIELTRHPKVVAIGEAGLDYHYDNSPRDAQERGFRAHIAAARETGLPLVIHAREADDDVAKILREETAKGAFPAVLHCYTGSVEFARRRRAIVGWGMIAWSSEATRSCSRRQPPGRVRRLGPSGESPRTRR